MESHPNSIENYIHCHKKFEKHIIRRSVPEVQIKRGDCSDDFEMKILYQHFTHNALFGRQKTEVKKNNFFL